MKIANLIITIALLFFSNSSVAGDLGGGGSSLKGGSLGGGGMSLILDEAEKKKLIDTGTAAKAFSVWLNQMSEEQKVETMKKVFEIQILPQLISE